MAFKFFGNASPAGERRVGRDDEYAFFLRMEECGRDEMFFRCLCKFEAWVCPDIGNGTGGEDEHATAIDGLTNAWANDVVGKVGGKKTEGRFLIVFGIPSGPPGVVTWIGG